MAGNIEDSCHDHCDHLAARLAQGLHRRPAGHQSYGNVSEYFRSLLREAQAREEEARLEALLLKGLASKRLPLDEAFLKRLEAKTEAIIDKHVRKAP
jgi:antitoxin ParD1/3/4